MPRHFPDPLAKLYDTAATSGQQPTADANGDYAPGSAGGGGGGISDGDTLSTGLTFPNTGLHLLDTNASHDLIIAPGSDLSADRTLTITTGDANRTLTLGGDATLNGGTHSGTNTGDNTAGSTVGDMLEWDGDSYEPQPFKMHGSYHAVIDNNVEEWGYFTRFANLSSGVDNASGMGTAVANGGSAARVTAAVLLARSDEFFHSGITLATGTTNNATGVSSISTFTDGIVGVPTPTASGGTRYDFEVYLKTDTAIPGSTTKGYIAVGFLGNATAVPSNGMWVEFRYDGTTNDTTWHWVNRKDGTQARTACTGTSLATSTMYYIKLTVERATNGDVTQTWTINGSTGTISTANANVGTAYIPTDATTSTGDAFGMCIRISKAGSATTTTNPIHLAFAGGRVRREFTPSYRSTIWRT